MFNFNDLPKGFSMIIDGVRRSGKSYALRHILHDMKARNWDVVMLFSGTADLQESFDYIPKQFQFPADGFEIVILS